MNGKNLETETDDYWKSITFKTRINNKNKPSWLVLKEKVLESRERFKSAKDDEYIECRICGFCGKELGHHIKTHGLSVKEYGITKCLKIRKKSSERVKGDKNPAFQHGGKFSPYSDKFIKYQNNTSNYTKNEVINKARNTKKNNPQRQPTHIEYYLSRGLDERTAREALSKRQSTFSLEKCIEKYGVDDGFQKWKLRQERWLETLNNKSDEEKDEINRKKVPTANYKTFINLNTPCIFYIIKTNKGLKIGITTRTLKERYHKKIKESDIILTYNETASNCFKIETLIKFDERLKQFRYKGEKFEGWTETFTCQKENILEIFNFYKENFNEQYALKYPKHPI